MTKDLRTSFRLPLLLGLATLLIAWALTFLAWETARRMTAEGHHAEFRSMVGESVFRIARRLALYEQILRASRGFLRSSVNVSEADYRAYIENLNLGEVFPGIQGIGVAVIVPREAAKRSQEAPAAADNGHPDYQVWPPGERDMYTAITRLEPLDEMNRRALGYDMYSEPVRRSAMARARDSGEAAMTGKVKLVQEGAHDVQSGFLIYLPIYEAGRPTDTVQDRRAAMVGWVYAPFRIDDFLQSLGGVVRPELHLQVHDGTKATPASCMYGCDHVIPHTPVFRAQEVMEYAGREWLLDFHSTPAFDASLEDDASWLIVGSGAVTGLLLAALVGVLAAGRGRALALAGRMTSELRQSHGKIEADQRRMRAVLESSLDAFVGLDADGRVTDWNPAAAQMFGWTSSEARGRNFARLIALEVDDRPVESVTRLLADDASGVRREVVASHRGGHAVPAELSLAMVQDEAGVIAHAFIRDLTDEKQTREREERQRKALDEAHAALQHALRLEAVGKLTGGVAHDFNNVLQIISANIQLMQFLSGGNPQLDNRLESAMQAVDRGKRLSSQLLSFARRQPLQPEVIDLRDLLEEMRELIARAAGEEIEVVVEADDDLCNTLVDPSQLENVLLNLVINARHAMDGRGRLRLKLTNVNVGEEDAAALPGLAAGEYVLLCISDTGVGMNDEVMEHAFEPFFTTRPHGGGSGLGLSMAYGFVRQSEGYIDLESEVGKGTTVRIYLPRSDQALPDHRQRAEPAGAMPDAADELILVVEDDPAVRTSVVSLLNQLGYRTLTAENGDQALDRLHEGHPIDLLFTDVVMPGKISSTELARQARMLYPDIGILFTSGYTQDAIMNRGRLDEGVNLLSKPYRADQLAGKVREVLTARQRAA